MANLKIFQLLSVMLVAVYVQQTQGYRFKLIERGTFPTIMVDAEFTIAISAFKNAKQVGQTIIKTSDGKESKITGKSGIKGKISANFKDSIYWQFLFEEKVGEVSLNRLVQFIPSKLFSQCNVAEIVEFKFPRQLQIGLWTNSYQCNKQVVTQYKAHVMPASDCTFEVTTSVLNLRAQAFNIIDGMYGAAIHCNGDSSGTTLPPPPPTATTTTTKTTTTQRPTLPPSTVNTYLVKEKGDPKKFCIELVGKIEFEIAYPTLNSKKETVNKIAKLGIPSQYKVSGHCESKPQRLVVNFNTDWYLTMLFTNSKPDSNSLTTDSKKYACSISNISLSYTMRNEIFSDAVDSGVRRHMLEVEDSEADNLPSKKENEAYYQCSKGTSVKLRNGAKINMSQLKFKAFNDDNDTTFKGTPAQCSADTETESMSNWSIFGYVILVAALLAIIAVAVFVIRKKKSKPGYNSIS